MALGILCNGLVCLAVWLSYGARSTTDKILAIVPPIAAFVAAGFEHSPTGLGAFFEARNLADTVYAAAVAVDDATRRFFFPGDGRSFYGGISWRWK